MALAEHLWNQCRLTDESVSWLCESLREAGADIECELSGKDPKEKAVQIVFECQAKDVLQVLADILSGRGAQKSILGRRSAGN